MLKFIIGVIVGLYISESYDYTFTNFINQIEKIFLSE